MRTDMGDLGRSRLDDTQAVKEFLLSCVESVDDEELRLHQVTIFQDVVEGFEATVMKTDVPHYTVTLKVIDATMGAAYERGYDEGQKAIRDRIDRVLEA